MNENRLSSRISKCSKMRWLINFWRRWHVSFRTSVESSHRTDEYPTNCRQFDHILVRNDMLVFDGELYALDVDGDSSAKRKIVCCGSVAGDVVAVHRLAHREYRLRVAGRQIWTEDSFAHAGCAANNELRSHHDRPECVLLVLRPTAGRRGGRRRVRFSAVIRLRNRRYEVSITTRCEGQIFFNFFFFFSNAREITRIRITCFVCMATDFFILSIIYRIRGVLGSLLILTCNGGVLFGFIVGFLDYFTQLKVLIMIPAIFFVVFKYFPESHVYLDQKQKTHVSRMRRRLRQILLFHCLNIPFSVAGAKVAEFLPGNQARSESRDDGAGAEVDQH